MPINGQSDVASHPQRWLAVQAVPQEGLNTTSATTVHEEVAVDPSSDQKVPVDESKKILALLELELAMIHQLECAAISGAGRAHLTAAKLATIRCLPEPRAQRTTDTQTT